MRIRDISVALVALSALFPIVAAEPAPSGPRDLVAIPQSAQGILEASDIPVTFKGSSFFLAEWSPSERARAHELGIQFAVILEDVSESIPLYLFELDHGEEPPDEWKGRILHRSGPSVVLAMDDVEADRFTLRGAHAVRLTHEPRGWRRSAPALFATYDCAHRPLVAEVLGKTNVTRWIDWIEKLSGVEPIAVGGTSHTIATRYSPSLFTGAANARAYDYVLEQAQDWGFSLEEDPFFPGGAFPGQVWKNLVLTIPGETTPGSEVLLTAHLDSIAGAGSTTTAPGANDNGTGVATLLEAARILRQYRFERTLRIVFFTGEEQGLFGSAAYATDHALAPIVGVLNLDMFGYDGNGDRCFEIHAGTLGASQEVADCFDASIGAYSTNLSRDYLTTTATNRSDHSSFWQHGVGAIEIAENFFNDGQAGGCVGVDNNPGYHKSTDTIAGNMSPPYAFDIARTALATFAAMAVPLEPCFAAAPALAAHQGIGRVDLDWSAIAGATSYRVYRSSGGCDGQRRLIATVPGTSWTDLNFPEAIPYSYVIEAVATDGRCVSSESNCASATPKIQRIYAGSPTYVDVCPRGGPGHANGIVEPGETVTLFVNLGNVGNTFLTSPSGTLSSPTIGVTIADSNATWPDLPPGASSPTLPDHFHFAADPLVTCPSTIVLEIGASTLDAGPWGYTWDVAVGAPEVHVNATSAVDVPRVIADLTTATSVIEVTGSETVTDVDVGVTLNHTYDADLDVFLIGPDGTRVELTTDNGANGHDFMGTVFDDEAPAPVTAGIAPFTGTYRPEGSLAALDGIAAAGPWTLEVTDDSSQDSGTLGSWSLTLTTSSLPVCNVCVPGPPAPGEPDPATPISLTKNEGTDLWIGWSPPPGPCQPQSYYVYRGNLDTLVAGAYSHDTALACDLVTPPLAIALADPSLGLSDYFLVVASNGTEEGSYGRDSDGTERPRSADACAPLQFLGICP